MYCRRCFTWFYPSDGVRNSCNPCIKTVLTEYSRRTDKYSREPSSETTVESLVEMWEKAHKRKLRDADIDLEYHISQLNWEIEELKTRLAIVSLPFDNEQPTSGIPQGDVVIIVENRTDKPLHAHKLILASKSPVFCRLFYSNTVEQDTGILRIDDATLDIMRAVIKFCYTAEIHLNFRDWKGGNEVCPEEVLKVAHKYAIDLLVKKCEDFLMRKLHQFNLSHLPRILKLARKFGAKSLEAKCIQLFKENFDEVISDVMSELLE